MIPKTVKNWLDLHNVQKHDFPKMARKTCCIEFFKIMSLIDICGCYVGY